MTKTETFLKCTKCAAQLLLNTQQGGIVQSASAGEITHFMAGLQPLETVVVETDG